MLPEVVFRPKFDFTQEYRHMKTRLYLESLDGRIVPDATPTEPPPPTPVETQPAQPPEAPWTAGEIANLRAVVAQMEQWGNEADAYYDQFSAFLSAQDTYGDWLEQQSTALSTGQPPPTGQAPAEPQKPGPLQRFVQLVQQVRDLPGAPLQNAIRLTQEADFLFDQADKAGVLSIQMLKDAGNMLDAAAATNDPVERTRLTNAANSALAQSKTLQNQEQQMMDLAVFKLRTLRAPYIQQLKAFLSDK